jgi:hypothetical protein
MIQTPPVGPLVYASADYDGLELRCVAQACLLLVGQSRLAQVLNAGEDPHLHMASSMLAMSYQSVCAKHEQEKAERSARYAELVARGLAKEQASVQTGKDVPAPADDARQAGKVANFGFWGGLGAEKLVLFARKTYKVLLSADGEGGLPSAKQLKRTWFATYPEARKYLDLVSKLQGPAGATFKHLFTNRIQGGASYTETANSFFQGLGAAATGHALFLIAEACYTPSPCRGCDGSIAGCAWCNIVGEPGVSAMYGTRPVNYVHDDNIDETPEYKGHEVAHELVRIMIEGAAPYLPDVPATAKPQLSRFWSKDAKQVWVPDPSSLVLDKQGNGKRLVPWPKAA